MPTILLKFLGKNLIFCSACNFDNPQDSQFCERCGVSLKKVVEFTDVDPIVLDKKRPFLFSVVLFLNYFGITFLVLVSINIIFTSQQF